jgi:hypothetical protein
MALVAIFLIVGGCKKDPQQLGFGVQPGSDLINVFTSDTASIISYSQRIDSISSSNAPLSLFGSLRDPVFGVTTASFSTSFRLSLASHSFGENPGIDSLILAFRLGEFYGDSLATQTMKVYELTEQLNGDTTYYSNSVVEYSPNMLADYEFVPNFNDSIIVGKDTIPPQIRVSLTGLTSELSDKLLNATDDQMSSNEDFGNLFYGLRVEAEPTMSDGCILYLDLLDDLSNLTIYYHNDEEDSLSYRYALTSNSVRFGNFDQDYDQASMDFKAQVIEEDTILGQKICYIQPMAGIRTVIFFPFIKEYFKDKDVSIAEARLFLEGVEESPGLEPPPKIIAARFTEDGNIVALQEQFEGEEFFGGFYVAEENHYWFRITNYIQNLMREDVTDYGLDIFVDGGAFNAGRFIIAGPEPVDPVPQDLRMRLQITYTRL